MHNGPHLWHHMSLMTIFQHSCLVALLLQLLALRLAAVQGYYTISAPAAGAVLYPGRTHRIQWAPADANTINITLAVGTNSPPSQATFPDQLLVLSATVQASSGYYDWLVRLMLVTRVTPAACRRPRSITGSRNAPCSSLCMHAYQ